MMGRGSYLGGSTIVILGRDGWSGPGKKKSKPKKAVTPEARAARKAKAKAKTKAKADANRRSAFVAAMKKYSRICGIAYLEGEPFPTPPGNLLSSIKGGKSKLSALVKSHGDFVIDDETRRGITERRKLDFVQKSASCFFKNQSKLEVPEHLKILIPDAELQAFTSGLENNPVYLKTLKEMKTRKKRAAKRQEEQRQMMAKIVVETKPKKRLPALGGDKR
jgi:hypothetical protein